MSHSSWTYHCYKAVPLTETLPLNSTTLSPPRYLAVSHSSSRTYLSCLSIPKQPPISRTESPCIILCSSTGHPDQLRPQLPSVEMVMSFEGRTPGTKADMDGKGESVSVYLMTEWVRKHLLNPEGLGEFGGLCRMKLLCTNEIFRDFTEDSKDP